MAVSRIVGEFEEKVRTRLIFVPWLLLLLLGPLVYSYSYCPLQVMLREIGGAMSPIWNSMVEAGRTQILFCVDSSAPEMVGLTQGTVKCVITGTSAHCVLVHC